jgi:hypothetical protein
MPSTPIAGFITKSEAAEQYQRSHRQLSRDLSDAMKLQDSKVLEHCRLHTEDGRVIEGMGVTPEIIDQLCVDGKNPTWYLRTTFLEKQYGRRGGTRRQVSASPDTTDAEKGSATAPRAGLEQILRDRIHDLERDKKDLKEELKIKNNQIAERVQLEKQTNELVRNLHTLMADLQRRLLPPPSQGSQQAPTHFIDDAPTTANPAPSDESATAAAPKVTPPATADEKGSRRSTTSRKPTSKNRKPRAASRRKSTAGKKPRRGKKEPAVTDAPNSTKSRSFLSRLFSR